MRDGGNWSPLHFACEGRNKDVVEYLVEKANCDVSELSNFVDGMHILIISVTSA